MYASVIVPRKRRTETAETKCKQLSSETSERELDATPILNRVRSKYEQSDFDESLGSSSSSRKRKCGCCVGCRRQNCGECKFCKDKAKFGGPNKLRQACKYKKCMQLKKPIAKSAQLSAAKQRKIAENLLTDNVSQIVSCKTRLSSLFRKKNADLKAKATQYDLDFSLTSIIQTIPEDAEEKIAHDRTVLEIFPSYDLQDKFEEDLENNDNSIQDALDALEMDEYYGVLPFDKTLIDSVINFCNV